MENRSVYTGQSAMSVLETNKVLRNTYMMLAATLVFSAVCAMGSMALNLGFGAALGMSIAALVIVWFVFPRVENSAKGLPVVFLFVGLLGASLGPMLNRYLALPNGGELVAQAMGMTALIFFGLSAYVLTSKKDFSFMTGFIGAGAIVLIVAAIAGIFLQIPAFSLAVSAGFALLSAALILWQTSSIVNGGETNYLRATVTLYISIYNIFTFLLQILGMNGDE